MKPHQVKRVLEEAAKLPPAASRRIITALAAKAAPEESAEDYLAQAEDAMAAAMEKAVLATLMETLS